jgi:hypothetical protein
VSLDLTRTGSTSVRGFLGTHISPTSKEVDCGVLLLLTRSFEGYSSFWDF